MQCTCAHALCGLVRRQLSTDPRVHGSTRRWVHGSLGPRRPGCQDAWSETSWRTRSTQLFREETFISRSMLPLAHSRGPRDPNSAFFVPRGWKMLATAAHNGTELPAVADGSARRRRRTRQRATTVGDGDSWSATATETQCL